MQSLLKTYLLYDNEFTGVWLWKKFLPNKVFAEFCVLG
jgi:hypothetical protein